MKLRGGTLVYADATVFCRLAEGLGSRAPLVLDYLAEELRIVWDVNEELRRLSIGGLPALTAFTARTGTDRFVLADVSPPSPREIAEISTGSPAVLVSHARLSRSS